MKLTYKISISDQSPKRFALTLISSFLFFGQNALSAMNSISLKSTDVIPSSRWSRGQDEPVKMDAITRALIAIKKAQLEKNSEACAKNAGAARAAAKTLAPWISVVEIDCATDLALKNSKPASATLSTLSRALELAEKNPSWLLEGPQISQLRQALIKGYLVLIEADLKTNRTRANQSIDRLQPLLSTADVKTKARFWKAAGELANNEQKYEAARDLYRRSLLEEDSTEVRNRIVTLDRNLSPVPPPAPTPLVAGAQPSSTAKPNLAPTATPAIEASKEELELVERVTASLKSGDLVAAVSDAVKIITQYPGGTRAGWASDRVMEAYYSLADRTDPKFETTRLQMVKEMDNVDADRLADWSRVAYKRGQWDDAARFAKQALKTISGTRATGLLDLAAKASLATDRFSDARDYFDKLIEQHAGTAASREALMRSGLLNYRQKEYERAQAEFEKLIAIPQAGQLESVARYWLWRTLQKLKSDRADAVADDLIRLQPFSYYGLRAKLDRSQRVLEWKPDNEVFTSKIWLTTLEKETYDRALLLIKAGWLDEAQSEIRELPSVSKAEDKAMRAMLWAAAAQYSQASRLANEAWDEKPTLRQPPLVYSSFPTEFKSAITEQAGVRKIDSYLVRGLIKQESAYNVRAVSTSNALGLMQMIPPTAREIAQDLKLGALILPDDLFVPERNIQMGTYYISRLLTRYQGSVPVALAAYNAGPTRIDRWMKARPSLKTVVASRSSLPDDELWIDEIPYWETSLYVKAILRNILIYKMLDKGRVEIPDPVWLNEG